MQTIPWQKIKALEDEIKALKSLGNKRGLFSHRSNKQVPEKKQASDSLYGILKGIKVSEKDFKEAEKALFPHAK